MFAPVTLKKAEERKQPAIIAKKADAFGACRQGETIVNWVYDLDRVECLSS